MQTCEQSSGQTIYQHGQRVSDYYNDLRDHLQYGTPLKYEWRLPDWINDPILINRQYDRPLMRLYHLFHDCGKPYCRILDEQGRQHFPDHAKHSAKIWTEIEGDSVIGDLIASDMDIHLLKANDINEFARRASAPSLLMTGLAEIHANAGMFGGIESTSFKIKWRHIDRKGRAIINVWNG